MAAMGFPSTLDPPTRIQSGNDAREVAELLRSRHAGYYMVWNLSDESYDSTLFSDQVCLRERSCEL